MERSAPKPNSKEFNPDQLQSVAGLLNAPDDAMAKLRGIADGVVRSCIRRASGDPNLLAPTSLLIDAITEAISVAELEVLRRSLDLQLDRLAEMLGISKATLHRRKESGRLTSSESDRVVRFALLSGKAVEALENQENARTWLTTPQFGLAGAVPLDYAKTEVGAREVGEMSLRLYRPNTSAISG